MNRMIPCVAAIALVVAACGSPTATDTDNGSGDGDGAHESVRTAVDELSADDRAAELTSLAEEEGGTLVWYTAMQQTLAEQLVDGFTSTYDIQVELYRADRGTVLSRVLEESDAGYDRGADVVETPGVEMAQMAGEGLFVPYEAPVQDDLVEEALFSDWTAERLNVQAVTWNTGLLGEGEVPGTLQELADPRYDRQLTLSSEDPDWFAAVWEYLVTEEGLAESEVEDIFRQMADNALIVDGHSERANLLAAGDSTLSASHYTHVSETLIRDGAPIAYKPMVEPAFLEPNGMALMSSAQHPAAALLFMDWVLSDGQEIIAESGATPTRQDLFEASRVGGVETVLKDVEAFAADQNTWVERWDNLLRRGEVVETE